MKRTKVMKKLFAVLAVLALTATFAVQALAGATPWGSSTAGNKIFAARGFSVSTTVDGETRELWLDSPFDHNYYDGINNKASIILGSEDDIIEVKNLEAGTYTFHTWFDKNPQGGNLSGSNVNQFMAVYIGDATTPTKLTELQIAPYNVSFGNADTTDKDPNGLEGQWSIPFQMTLLEGETYRFVFLRGIQAKNGLTLVLYPGTTVDGSKSGYVGSLNGTGVTADEQANYDAHKFDVYQYISNKTELGKDASGNTVYELTQIPMEHTVKAGEPDDPTPSEPLAVTAFTSSEGTSLTEKTETALTATATGGKAPYTYKFIVYNNQTNEWYRIRDFESGNSCTWYTGVPGTKTLYVDVKDSEGTVVRKELGVTVSKDTTEPLAVTVFESTKGTALAEKTETTLRASATGGKSPYTYKFIVYNTQTKQWYKIRDFESASTCAWYTGAAGTKTLYVDIKDSAGTVVRKELNVKVSGSTAPLAASSFTSSKGTSLNSGDTTTLSAKATGGSGSGYQYKFIVYNPQTNQWYKIRDYSAASSASWYTGAAGTKTLYVDIKDSAGNYVRTPLNVTVK